MCLRLWLLASGTTSCMGWPVLIWWLRKSPRPKPHFLIALPCHIAHYGFLITPACGCLMSFFYFWSLVCTVPPSSSREINCLLNRRTPSSRLWARTWRGQLTGELWCRNVWINVVTEARHKMVHYVCALAFFYYLTAFAHSKQIQSQRMVAHCRYHAYAAPCSRSRQ